MGAIRIWFAIHPPVASLESTFRWEELFPPSPSLIRPPSTAFPVPIMTQDPHPSVPHRISPASAPLKVLLVTGGGWHDFEAQQEILTRGLGERAAHEFTIDHAPGKDPTAELARFLDPDWAQAFDLVLYNMSLSREQKPETAQAIVDGHVKHGVPAVLLHGSLHSYRFTENPDWFRFIGARSMRHEAMGPLANEVVEPEHPLMKGVPDPWSQSKEELYVVEEMHATAHPLARGRQQDAMPAHPTVWINQYRGVRVFATTLGHHNATMATGTYLDLVARGIQWATGRLTPYRLNWP